MSTFTTIPLIEIQEFLRSYDISFPLDQEETYLLAWELIRDNPDLFISSIPIQDFILAHDHQGDIDERHTTSSILLSPERELVDLSQSLGLTSVNKERIIRILGYLNLLDNDESFFNKLPKETLKLIAMKLDCRSLGLFCSISSNFNKSFCLTGEMTEMLRTKLQENTQLDLSQYTKEELGFLCRIGDRNTVLSAGGTYSLVRTSQGLVYSFGAGDERTGNGRETTDNDYNIPMPIKINNIVAVSVGWNYSLILNDQGQVFSFGGNYYGQLGLGLSRGEVVTFPTKTIDDQKVGKIVAISAGHDHSLILNSQGQVFSFGSNEDGKLGLGTKEKFYPEPMRIGALENIIAISAGYNHSLFLNSQGQAYSCGGNDYGQLGLEDGVDVPTLIDDPDLGEIIAISAGFYCSLLLNSQGQVFNCSEDGIVPVDISDIVSISAGEGNFLLLNSRGQVFSLGNNRKGQSGLGPRQKDDIKTPTLIRTPVGKIVSISAGDSHSLILNSRGQVFSFGDDEYGKLGLGDHPLGTSILVPTLIEGLVL